MHPGMIYQCAKKNPNRSRIDGEEAIFEKCGRRRTTTDDDDDDDDDDDGRTTDASP